MIVVVCNSVTFKLRLLKKFSLFMRVFKCVYVGLCMYCRLYVFCCYSVLA